MSELRDEIERWWEQNASFALFDNIERLLRRAALEGYRARATQGQYLRRGAQCAVLAALRDDLRAVGADE